MVDAPIEPEDTGVERHASWAELFFDLVAVAGVAALAHVLGSGRTHLRGMFGLSVAFGYAGLPHLRAGRIPIRAALGHHRIAVPLLLGALATDVSGRTLVIYLGPRR